MLVNNSFRFTDLSNMQDRILDIGIGVIITEAIHQIRKFRLLSRKYNLRKKYGWFKIGCNIVCFIPALYLWSLFSNVHVEFLAKRCSKVILYNIKTSATIFSNIEPKISLELWEKIGKIIDDYKISEITGISNYS